MATKKGKEEGKVKKEGAMKKGKVEEKEVKGFEFSEDDLVDAIDALNEVLDEPIVIYEGKGKKKMLRDQDELVDEFKEIVEGLDEDDVPELATSFYKGLTEEPEEEEKSVKKGKGKKVEEESEEEESEEEEPEEEEGPVAEDDLVAAIEALNESGLAGEEVVIYEGKGKKKTVRDLNELVGEFMTACETVSEEDEDNLPEAVVEVYNNLSDYMKEKAKAEAKAKKDKKADKKTEKEAKKADKKKEAKGKDPAKVARGKALADMAKNRELGANGSRWSKGSSADAVFQMIADAGKKGITLEELLKKKSKVVSSNPEGRIKHMVRHLLGEKLVEKKGEAIVLKK